MKTLLNKLELLFLNILTYLKNIYTKYKVAIYSSIISTFITHLYFFTRRLGNEDDLNLYTGSGRVLSSGRWLSGTLFTTEHIIPIIKFLLVIIVLTTIVVIICDLFKFKSKKSMVLVSLLITTFPSLAMSFSYSFMIETYMLALLFSTLAVYLTIKFKYGLLFGSALICLSLGHYQSYIAIASALSMTYLIKLCLEKEELSKIIKLAIKLLIMALIGISLYFILLNIILKINNTTLSSYKGANEMGIPPLNYWPSLLKRTYWNVIDYYRGLAYFGSNKLRTFTQYSIIVIGFITFIIYLKKEKILKNKLHTILLLVLIALFPLAINIIDFMAFKTSTTILNIYQFVIPYILIIYLYENTILKSNYKHILSFIFIFIILSFSWNNFITTNRYYLKIEEFYEYTYSINTRLLTRIEATENYDYDMPVMFATDNQKSEFYQQLYDITPWQDIVRYDQALWGRFMGYQDIYYNKEYKLFNFISNQLGVKLQPASVEEKDQILKTSDYQNLKHWPSKDSIKVINNVLVVKF